MENGHQDTQSSGPDKQTTIHDCAQSGDIDTFQKLVQDNPSLLNERKAIMLETPLHLSASNNKTEIVKFLLEWKGDDHKVDLEAKNMYGETPLHVAAKNRCTEAAKLLLAHGAVVEAKTKYGVTPLFLSVCYSIRAEDSSIVETLLENNADCEAADKAGMTLVDHLSKIQESGKLLDLLLSHEQEKRKKKFLEPDSKLKKRMDALEKQLSNIVGLDELKLQLRKWAKGIMWNERRKAIGLKIGTDEKLPHMAFLGNPGTGETVVARILGRLLHNVGILRTDIVKEVHSTDLVDYFGDSDNKKKTKEMINEAEGGILFVNKAYNIIPKDRRGKDYRSEAFEEIMSCMDDGKVLVIFAGNSEEMQRAISSNEGFRRRVTYIFNFKGLTCEELTYVLRMKMANQAKDNFLYGFKLHSSCTVNAIAKLMKRETTKKQRKIMNEGLVDVILNNAKGNLNLRISTDDCTDRDELVTIKLEDIEAAMESVVGAVDYFNIKGLRKRFRGFHRRFWVFPCITAVKFL